MNTNRFTQFTLVLTIVALIAGLSACDQVQQVLFPKPPDPEPSEPQISIGVVVALTGQYADALGLPMRDGFELAREEINDSGLFGPAKLTFIVEDTGSVSAVEAVNKLIDQADVYALTGFAISTQLQQVIPIAQENGIVIFSSASSAPGLNEADDFIFRAGLTSAVLNPAAVNATHQKYNYQKAATIYMEDDTYSIRSDEAFRAALVQNGVELLTTETFQDNDTDFSAQLTRIMELNPDLLCVSGITDELVLIMKQARQLMPSVHLIVPELTGYDVEQAGGAAEGVTTAIGWLSTIDTPMNQAFIQNYTEKYGTAPNVWAAQSYATLHILAAAMIEALSTGRTTIRDALAQTEDVDTILGKFSFDPGGDAVYDPIILTIKDGEFQLFD